MIKNFLDWLICHNFLFIILAELIVTLPPIATYLFCAYLCIIHLNLWYNCFFFCSIKNHAPNYVFCSSLSINLENLWFTPPHGDVDEACYYYSYWTGNYPLIKRIFFKVKSLWPNPLIIHMYQYKHCTKSVHWQVDYTAFSDIKVIPRALKFIIHTKPGPGPSVKESDSGLLTKDGLPKELQQNTRKF